MSFADKATGVLVFVVILVVVFFAGSVGLVAFQNNELEREAKKKAIAENNYCLAFVPGGSITNTGKLIVVPRPGVPK